MYVIIITHDRILGLGEREDKVSGILEGDWRIQREETKCFISWGFRIEFFCSGLVFFQEDWFPRPEREFPRSPVSRFIQALFTSLQGCLGKL